MSLSEKLQSIRDMTGGVYVKPSLEKLNKLIENLSTSQIAQDYLQIIRGLSDDTIKHFKLGYDLEKKAISIPIFKRGELINIKYRLINPPENTPKYTQEKGCEVWLYNDDGISCGLEKKGILVTEGEFDLMSCWQIGLKNVVSPASGKDSYGMWIELLDAIPKIYIAYDNDKPGKGASLKMAERLGTEKSLEVLFPDGVKDANDFLLKQNKEDFLNLIKTAKPFYKHKFKGIIDILEDLKINKTNVLKLDSIPYVEFEEDWLAIISGSSNVGKTTYVMNIADELSLKNIPTLILPFERGIKTVGKRFLQVKFNLSQRDLSDLCEKDWGIMVEQSKELPLFFSMPNNNEVKELIIKAKRIFNIKVVIVDHLNYLVRRSDNNENIETSKMLQEFKLLAQEHNIIFLLVHHINKPTNNAERPKKPKMEDLKGSSSIYQDPEVVIMLSSPTEGKLEVDILKNKGSNGFKIFDFNIETGKIKESEEKEENINSEELLKQWSL